MYLVANGVNVVAKSKHIWKSGEVSYRIDVSTGMGGLLRVDVPKEVHDRVVPFECKYDMELDVHTEGYKTYCDFVTMVEA